ncbi:hypothetical protein [Olleya sp. YS]|uniref:hypothetical protein n=1 Tax=Olleya sp. YS TaxID=3028318 RepID=UPI0024344B5D|nr:hypothetical protein [Olleya sp. YS]WGD33923.1 hypothetical protein Ollyesu_09040 [Olleya sp. YS]
MKNTLLLLTLILSTIIITQNNDLPYYELPEASESYTAGTVAARQVDALGFRFYHATDGLTEKDLEYKPTDSVRTTAETVDHIYDLSKIILNSTLKKANSKESANLTFEDKRAATLKNLKQAADILRASEDISQFKIIFGERQIPFWNNINGPIADAIWHCGQIASFRRVTGNPINPKVNHFTGTVKK